MESKHSILFTLGLFVTLFMGCNNSNSQSVATKQASMTPMKAEGKPLSELKKAYFASGCFWCVEAIFESVEGVQEAVSGYAGGDEQSPTYQSVSRGVTGHTEAVEVYYDPEVVSYATLLEVYYGSHNPTTVNGQHPDYGTQYRSAIFYTNDEEKALAEKAKATAGKDYKEPIATEIAQLKTFWKAEEYHQDFERKNPNQSYVRAVSIPRLNRFKAKFPHLLKKEAKNH